MRLEHLTRGARILAVGFVVEIAQPIGRDVERSGEEEEKRKSARRVGGGVRARGRGNFSRLMAGLPEASSLG
jgi:hypothetical protein